VLLINKVQGFSYYKCLSFLNVSYEFKFNFIIQNQVLNSYYILRLSYSISFLPHKQLIKRGPVEFVCTPRVHHSPRREIRSPLGFSGKSVKKSRNFRCYAQKPSILPQSCPMCWDITDFPP
jgi:hypothetical protein